MFTDITI